MKDRDGAQVAFISLESVGVSDVRFGLRGHSSWETAVTAVPLGRPSRETIELKVP
jgi:hypothetical protein